MEKDGHTVGFNNNSKVKKSTGATIKSTRSNREDILKENEDRLNNLNGPAKRASIVRYT